ncbi:MAG: reverse transcriptase, partial [Cyanobacteria bacterium J06597_16]
LEVQVPRVGKNPLVARFGSIPLCVNREAIIQDRVLTKPSMGRTELIQRLLADACEACGSTLNVEVHHIRKLADLDQPGRNPKPGWVKLMAARQRKTHILHHS